MTTLPNLTSAPGAVDASETIYVRLAAGTPPNRKRTLASLVAFWLGPDAVTPRGFFGKAPVAQPAAEHQGAITDGSGGTVSLPTGVSAEAYRQTILMPVALADLAVGDLDIKLPYAFSVTAALFRTVKPASTAAKAATLTVTINGAAVTGGVMALTSANQNAIGALVAATGITANNFGPAGQTLGVDVSAVTAFVEGSGWVEFTVINHSLAHAAATQAAQGNAIRSALVSLGLIKGAA